MKKLIILLFTFLVITGCEDTKSKELTVIEEGVQDPKGIHIEPLDLKGEEYAIVKATGVLNSMIFTIDHDDAAKQSVKLWIDHYKDGEFKGTMTELESMVSPEAQTSKIYLSIMDIDSKQEIWTLALREGGNVTSSKMLQNRGDMMITVTRTLQSITIQNGEAASIGVFVRGKNSTISSDDFEGMIKQNDEVFVLNCGFK
ncbi:hypothetical protein PASE110613_06950 [Paenibacillus sediminis]|uniref:Uncharacterized protein n=1 Tax=Paenibacillus sediminis TaxID=664909 RepID=A0ABS4H1W5_9BACL|nr:hypothetical protein [Paenibacillus sediminis]MBP1936523.1 hypothetical protein [Paenibacillus sediminis]